MMSNVVIDKFLLIYIRIKYMHRSFCVVVVFVSKMVRLLRS